MPLLEVRCIRRLQHDTGSRYAISAADWDFVDHALAVSGSSLVRQIETGQVVLNTLIRLTDFYVEELNGHAFLVIVQAQALGEVPEMPRIPSDRLQ